MEGQPKVSKVGTWGSVGICLSAACLIQCVAMPFIIAFLPFIGLELLESELIHLFLAVMVAGVSFATFVFGYRIHKDVRLVYWAVPGLAFILAGAFWEPGIFSHEWEKGITALLGGACLITAHLLNRTFCRSCVPCREGKSAHLQPTTSTPDNRSQ